MEKHDILVVVPAYNEEDNIALVLSDIKKNLKHADVLVVNDCSLDSTSKKAREFENVCVIDLPCNMGIGGAVQTGFKYAKINGYKFVIQMDGDGQHLASEVEKLFDAFNSKNSDVVIGSRFLDVRSFRTSSMRRAGIKIFYFLYRLILGIKITDGTSGFRLYNKKAIDILAENYPDDYPEPEVVVLLFKKGLKIVETGVEMRERKYGKSSITPFKSIYYMSKVIISILFAWVRD